MRITIEIGTPLVLVKHSFTGETEPYHTFEVWAVPEDVQELYDRALVASNLVQTFEGDFAAALDECRQFLSREYHEIPTLFIEKSDEVFAIGRES